MSADPRTPLSPRQLAAALGASESSVKRWIDGGAIRAERTPGGHRRIPLQEAVRFVRASNLHVASPDALGLRAAPRERAASWDPEWLLDPDDATVESLLKAWYLDGRDVAWIADGPVRQGLARAAERWREGPGEVAREHAATMTLLHGLAALGSLMPAPGPQRAIGAAPAGDPYILPTLLCGLALQSIGLRVRNLGPDTPAAALVFLLDAPGAPPPALVWLSCSALPHRGTAAYLEEVAAACAPRGIPLAVGGRSRPAALPRGCVATDGLESLTALALSRRGA